ncbi:MAG: 5-formyltetrahydrofolate cyclo-ligase [Steroidobacteraceae bacterium]
MNHPVNDEASERPTGRDVARWRKAERERLLALRLGLSVQHRTELAQSMGENLQELIGGGPGIIVSVYWPIRAEPDLRPWMRAASARGIRIALPIALAVGQPLVFREWRPDAPMTRGLWNIPYPAEGPHITPQVLVAPLVGFDAACYRLGYGGGFFDRTLASIGGNPMVIGVGFPETSIPTIFPQAHDIPMSWIVTGAEAPRRR